MTALYRAYRPQRFDDVVGQDAVVRTLRNAIAADRVAHAYLFSGSKGTGKTTMAKLLAKAMNCEHGMTTDPCGTCESCTSIAQGCSVDVAEIDAASNTGVQDVREKIIDTVAYRPARGRRRVYILDEAHMLSTSAFNALLKTIEEPPEHVLFVFCTTETHKLMATVRDRCQRLTFAPPSFGHLLDVLERVAREEGITADRDALQAIAAVAQGSFRNALGTLELLATAFERSFTADDVYTHLGLFSDELLLSASDAITSGNAGAALATVEEVVQSGGDIVQFCYALAEHLRVLLLLAEGVHSASTVAAKRELFAEQAERLDTDRALSAIDCLNDAVARMRLGSDARLALEAALARACQGLGLPALALRLAHLEHQAGVGVGKPLPAQSGPAVPSAPRSVASPRAAAETTVRPVPAAVKTPPGPQQQSGETAEAGSRDVQPPDRATGETPPASELGELWPAVVGAAGGGSLKATLAQAQPLRYADGVLKIALPPASAMLLRSAKKHSELSELVSTVAGDSVHVEIVDLEASEPGASATRQPASSAEGSGGGTGNEERGIALLQSQFDARELGQ